MSFKEDTNLHLCETVNHFCLHPYILESHLICHLQFTYYFENYAIYYSLEWKQDGDTKIFVIFAGKFIDSIRIETHYMERNRKMFCDSSFVFILLTLPPKHKCRKCR